MDGERQGRNGPALYLASETRADSSWVSGEAEAEVVLVCFGVEPKEEGPGLSLGSGRSSPFDLTQ